MSATNTPQETPSPAAKPTIVAFEHQFFTSFPGMHFRISEQTGEPVLLLQMGKGEAALSLSGLQREFSIKDDSPDGRMLHYVREALTYVNGLRLGDPLPKEIFSTESSWEPSEKHRIIAYQRLTMQLITWLAGDEHIISSPEELLQVANDPSSQKKVSLAFAEAAERIGIGRDHKEDVIGYIERMANELAYIEALRDRFKMVENLNQTIQSLRKLYGNERSVLEIADPVARLTTIATDKLRRSFDEVDGQTGEIQSVLKNIESQTAFIAATRNDLFRRLRVWDDVLVTWKPVAIRRSNTIPDMLRDLYHFLAQRFLPVNEWVLLGQLDNDKKKRKTRAMEW